MDQSKSFTGNYTHKSPPWLYEDGACQDTVNSPQHLLGPCSPSEDVKMPPMVRSWNVCKDTSSIDPFVEGLFPHSKSKKVLQWKCEGVEADKPNTKAPIKVGVVFSGGPAPGGHNVVAGLYQGIQQLAPNSTMIGFVGGPDGLLKNNYLEIDKEKVASFWNTGGFNMLSTGRTKIDSPEKFDVAFETIAKNKLDAFIVIGGDDSNTNAAYLAEYAERNNIPVAVVGVPKTIDGDLQSEYLPISFGFDTASSVYAGLVSNLCKDALSSRKYYHFVRLMGRSASHLTLETGLRSRPNLTLIAEECKHKKKTLKDTVREIADLVHQRDELGKNFGVVLIPEGLLEQLEDVRHLIEELNALMRSHAEAFAGAGSIDAKLELSNRLLSPLTSQTFSSFPDYIQHQLVAERDSHGNVPLSAIETEKLLGHMVKTELSIRGQAKKFKPLYHFLGYEGRCAAPTAFDRVFSHSLGQVAAILAAENKNGYLAAIACNKPDPELWAVYGVPLVRMLVKENRAGKDIGVIKKVLVDVGSPAFKKLSELRATDQLEDNYCYNGPYDSCGPVHLPLIIEPSTLS